MKYLLQLILVIFVCEGCNSQSGPGKKSEPVGNVNQVVVTKTDTSALAVSQDSLLNDYALFLAGMQPVNAKTCVFGLGFPFLPRSNCTRSNSSSVTIGSCWP